MDCSSKQQCYSSLKIYCLNEWSCSNTDIGNNCVDLDLNEWKCGWISLHFHRFRHKRPWWKSTKLSHKYLRRNHSNCSCINHVIFPGRQGLETLYSLLSLDFPSSGLSSQHLLEMNLLRYLGGLRLNLEFSVSLHVPVELKFVSFKIYNNFLLCSRDPDESYHVYGYCFIS